MYSITDTFVKTSGTILLNKWPLTSTLWYIFSNKSLTNNASCFSLMTCLLIALVCADMQHNMFIDMFVHKRKQRVDIKYCFIISFIVHLTSIRSVWRYQRGNHNPYIEEERTTQCPNEKVQKCTQRSTKPTHTTKDRVAEPY